MPLLRGQPTTATLRREGIEAYDWAYHANNDTASALKDLSLQEKSDEEDANNEKVDNEKALANTKEVPLPQPPVVKTFQVDISAKYTVFIPEDQIRVAFTFSLAFPPNVSFDSFNRVMNIEIRKRRIPRVFAPNEDERSRTISLEWVETRRSSMLGIERKRKERTVVGEENWREVVGRLEGMEERVLKVKWRVVAMMGASTVSGG